VICFWPRKLARARKSKSYILFNVGAFGYKSVPQAGYNFAVISSAPMDIHRLLELVKQGEGLTLDFKQELDQNSTNIAKLLCSYANSAGGILLVGVTDEGECIGVPNPDGVQKRIVSISQSTCQPPINPQMGSIHLENGGYIVWADVAPLDDGLCLVEGRCYIRVGPVSLPITTNDQLQEALRKKSALGARQTNLQQRCIIGLRFTDPNAGFKNRTEKLATIRKFLAETRAVKLISIVGRAGIGKTALISKVCCEVETQGIEAPGAGKSLVDGIFYYSCRGTDLPLVGRLFSDFGKVLGAHTAEELAECWRDRTQSIADKARFLLSKLGTGYYLLVLDNLENLLDSSGRFINADLAEFFELALTTGHCLRILATTRRQPLVDCAALRAIRNVLLDEGLPDSEAAALLREMDPMGDVGLLNESEEILLGVARRCYGVPRALEAFVGILMADPVLSPAALLADTKLFDAHVAENLVADHYARLSDHERRVVEVIALMNRRVPSEAIAYMVQPSFPDLCVEACLRSLVSQHVVSLLRDQRLYGLHPLDQQHAYDRIPATGDSYNRAVLHERAAKYYLDVVSRPASECAGLSELDPQLAAFLHRRNAGDGDGACRILDGLDPGPLSIWGHYQLIVELRESIRDILGLATLKSVNLGCLGRAYANLGDTERAIECFMQSMELARTLGSTSEVAMRLGNLGEAYFALGDTEKALAHFREAHEQFCDLKENKEAGFWLGHIGLAHMRLGQLEEAAQCFRSAEQIAAHEDDPRQGSWLSNLASLLMLKGETTLALEHYERSVEMARRIQDRRGLVARLRGIGLCFTALSRFEEAAAKCEEALEIARSIKNRYGIAATLHSLGRVYCRAGDLRRSRYCLQQSIAEHSPSTEYQSCVQIGIVDLIDRGPAEATESLKTALSLCSARLARTPNDYDALYSRALAYAGLSDFDGAERDLRAGLNLCTSAGILENVKTDLALLTPVTNNSAAVGNLISIINQASNTTSVITAKQSSETL